MAMRALLAGDIQPSLHLVEGLAELISRHPPDHCVTVVAFYEPFPSRTKLITSTKARRRDKISARVFNEG
jgi:hypothetical protein